MEIVFVSARLKEYIFSLEKSTVTKVIKMFDLLEKFGRSLPMPYSRRISANLFELRIRGDQELRLFYCFHNGKAIVLHGFVKKSQKIPTKEILLAVSRRSTLH